jgi:RNA polymerase sigma-70 factor (ECF subfamily)
MDDQQIVQYYFDRDEQAITCSAQKYGALCHRVAMNILDNREDSEECVNDTYLHAWNAIPPQKPQNLSAFLGKITRHLALDRLDHATAQKRGGKELCTVLEEWQGVLPTELSAEHIDLKATLDRFLRELPTERRRLFLQRYWYMLPIKEIARDNRLSESNVKMQLLRTREALKTYLEKEGIYV